MSFFKSIAFHKMNPSDPNFVDCLFELRELMHAKGDVGVISTLISQVIRIHKHAHCHGHTSNESLSLGDDHSLLSMDIMMRMMIVTLILMS